MAGITSRQQRFVDEYLVDLNATQAAIRAGYSAKTAYAIGQKLLRKAEIAQAVQKAQERRGARTEITQDRVLRELAKIGFFDARRMFAQDGRPLHITALDDETAGAIAGLEVFEEYNGQGTDRVLSGYVKKYKLADKKGALELIGRHLGMFRDRIELTGSGGGPVGVVTYTAEQLSALPEEQLQAMLDAITKLGRPAEE